LSPLYAALQGDTDATAVEYVETLLQNRADAMFRPPDGEDGKVGTVVV
jgi:hypothetical protein